VTVTELRLVVTTDDHEAAVVFYRDVLGMPEVPVPAGPGGRIAILEAGRATLEIVDPVQAAYIDDVEVGRRVAGHVRVAFAVDDAAATTAALAEAGGSVVAPPTETPWKSVNARLEAPAGLQITIFARPMAT
jgi:predicted enzyme related to lactoylglutathione lyase